MAGNRTESRRDQNVGVNGNLQPAQQFEPGQSGNPAGRPKGAKTGVRARLRALLKTNATPEAIKRAKDAGLDIEGETVSDLIAARLSFEAANGDTTAINTVFKQTELPIELDNGDDPEGSRSKTLSPNASEIASALDRE